MGKKHGPEEIIGKLREAEGSSRASGALATPPPTISRPTPPKPDRETQEGPPRGAFLRASLMHFYSGVPMHFVSGVDRCSVMLSKP